MEVHACRIRPLHQHKRRAISKSSNSRQGQTWRLGAENSIRQHATRQQQACNAFAALAPAVSSQQSSSLLLA